MSSLAGVAVRVLAARTLDAVMHRGRSLKAELATTLPQIADVRDRALLEAICFSALRQRTRYDAALRTWLQKPLAQRDGELRALLFAGFAQIDVLQLPPHAAFSATVEATRALGRPHQAGMVNAVLRRAQREGFPATTPADAWPRWLRERVEADWPQQAEAVFAASTQAAPLWLRVNRRRVARDAYRQRLLEAGIASMAPEAATDALRIDVSLPITALPGFAEGLVSVQDISAQQVADALSPAAGARVLDACAAPGGKSAHLLERHPSLRLLALDVDARRLSRIEQTLQRIGGEAELRLADASQVRDWWDGQAFDAILLDAPCSATGIVRRQPDVLLHRRPADVEASVRLQARLLDALWPTLRSGGTLVYATCSLLKDENERQIDAFLGRTPDAQAQPLGECFGHSSGPGRQRLPGEDAGDGFFYARLGKR